AVERVVQLDARAPAGQLLAQEERRRADLFLHLWTEGETQDEDAAVAQRLPAPLQSIQGVRRLAVVDPAAPLGERGGDAAALRVPDEEVGVDRRAVPADADPR